jgi:predicted transcriptional regulator YheO
MKIERALEDDATLRSYVPMVDFYAETLGRHCEVILHDLRQLESSIIAIRNNHISGRQIGGCITGFGLELLEKRIYEKRDYVANYAGKTEDGKKTLRSSTFFIRNKMNKVIGMLCVNLDISAFVAAKSAIEDLISVGNDVRDGEPVLAEESFDLDPQKLISSRVAHVLAKFGIEPERMTSAEKSAVVLDLAELGVFRIKGAVSEVSQLIQVSEPTIYRYLKKSTVR